MKLRNHGNSHFLSRNHRIPTVESCESSITGFLATELAQPRCIHTTVVRVFIGRREESLLVQGTRLITYQWMVVYREVTRGGNSCGVIDRN
jgi:hypothetical protein